MAGVLARQQLRDLVERGAISSDSDIPAEHFQPASLDLTLGKVAYRLRCSFLPGNRAVREKLLEYQMGELDLEHGAVLEQDRPYLIPLNERLTLPAGIRGRANPRSSTGRIDVFTRLVTDFGQHFDEVRDGYQGELFLEVVPRSFTIKVRTGLRLNQLRLSSGFARISDAELVALSSADPVAYPGTSMHAGERVFVADGLFLSVDLSGEGGKLIGYKARKSNALLDLDRIGAYDVTDFWERVIAKNKRLILDREDFYLLVSRERVRIPPGFAAEMAAYDPTSGELRTHYAGFFDPGFGHVQSGERPGTPAVLEVRAHDVPFALEHSQRLCKLTFERMETEPDELYGSTSAIGSRYQRQYLTLGRQFRADTYGRAAGKRQRALEARPVPLELGTLESVQPLAASLRE